MFRIRLSDSAVDRIIDIKDLKYTGSTDMWMGLGRTDAPLFLRDLGTRDVYGISLEESNATFRPGLTSYSSFDVTGRLAGNDLLTRLLTNQERKPLLIPKAIADITVREDVFRMGWIILDLLPKLIYQNTQIFPFLSILCSPD